MSSTKIAMHQFKHNGKYYVYDTTSNSIFEVAKELYKDLSILKKLGRDEFETQYGSSKLMFLIKKGYLGNYEALDICHPHYEFVDFLLDNRISHLVLQTTKDCNFKCRYCGFAGDGIYDRKHSAVNMSRQVAQKAIDYFFDHSINSNKVSICFYGGEPLLNFELIKYVVKYSQEKFFATELEFHMTTNASLLTENIINYLENNNFNLLISLDGPKDIQDRHRLFLHNGIGTFDAVIKNVNNLANNHRRYFSKYVRFNPVMLNAEERSQIEHFFIHELNISKDKVNIHTADLKGIDYINDYINPAPISHESVYTDEDYELNKSILNEHQYLKSPWQHNGPCIPGVDRLFVSSEGKFYPCEKVPEISCVEIGDVHHGIDAQKVKELTNIGRLTAEECNNCWARHFCKICLAQCIDYKHNEISRDLKLKECKQTQYSTELFLKKYVETECENENFISRK